MVASGRTLAEPRLAPDGTAVVFSTVGPLGTQLVRIDLFDTEPMTAGPEVVVTSDQQPVGVHAEGGGSFNWFPDSASLVFAARDGALYRVSREGGPATLLVAAPDAVHWYSAPEVSPDGRRIVCTRNSDEENVVVVLSLTSDAHADLASGEVGAVVADVAGGPDADFRLDPVWVDNETVAWHEWSNPRMPWDGSRIALRTVIDGRPVGGVRIQAGGDRESVAQPRAVSPAPGASVLGWLGEATGFANVTVVPVVPVVPVAPSAGSEKPDVVGRSGDVGIPVVGIPAVIEEPYEHGGATWGSGARTWCFSPDGRSVAYCRNEAGFGRLCTAAGPGPDLLDGTTPGSDDRKWQVTELGRGVHHGLSWQQTSAGRQRIASIRTGGRTPTQLVIYDGVGTDSVNRTIVARGPAGGWEQLDTPEPVPVSWTSSDGVTLHGRLYLPTGADAAISVRFPVIVSIHGGPTGQSLVQFNARVAYWLSQGWAVFTPDYRGSTGWGRDYREALNGWWGVRDVDDVASGVAAMLASFPLDGSRVVAMGGSAGGLTVLCLLAKHPTLFRAAVVLYPVTDLNALDATTHRYERFYNEVLIGPKPRHEEQYAARSPVNLVPEINTPLLVLHGETDRTVVIAQSEELVRRLYERGVTVAFHRYPGEGHGWKRSETTVDELQRIDAFLKRYG